MFSIQVISSLEQLQTAFATAPEDQLFILAAVSDSECFLGDNPVGMGAMDNSKADRQEVGLRTSWDVSGWELVRRCNRVSRPPRADAAPPRIALPNVTQACNALSDALHRVARDCKNVTFLQLVGDADAEAKALSAELGVKAFPTVQCAPCASSEPHTGRWGA